MWFREFPAEESIYACLNLSFRFNIINHRSRINPASSHCNTYPKLHITLITFKVVLRSHNAVHLSQKNCRTNNCANIVSVNFRVSACMMDPKLKTHIWRDLDTHIYISTAREKLHRIASAKSVDSTIYDCVCHTNYDIDIYWHRSMLYRCASTYHLRRICVRMCVHCLLGVWNPPPAPKMTESVHYASRVSRQHRILLWGLPGFRLISDDDVVYYFFFVGSNSLVCGCQHMICRNVTHIFLCL